MEVLYILIPVSIAIVFLAIWIFFRASDSGQFDDLVGPGIRVVQDDDRVKDEALSVTPSSDKEKSKPR